MPEKPPRRLPGEWEDETEGDDVPRSGAGRLAEDDRGNVTWEWADDEELLADNTAGATYRLKALVDPNLDVIESEPAVRGIENKRGLKTGYDPYESGALVRTERRKKKNLRELSKWIKLRRKVARGPSGDSGDK